VLPLLISALLALALLLRIGAGLSAAWFQAPDAVQPQVLATAGVGRSAVDAVQLRSGVWFGTAPSARGAAVTAPPTADAALNLRLEGVILASSPAASIALIAVNGKQSAFAPGAALPAGAGVVLTGIARDHALIDNRGRRETLWLYSSQQPPSAVTPLPNPAPMTLPDRGAITAAAGTWGEIVVVEAAQQDGQLIGFRLTPGVRFKEFLQLGFRMNDIVTAANGVPLTELANVPQLYSLMNGGGAVSFSLLRDGMPLTLDVSLPPAAAATGAVP
jgi:general secretion pathway protein C